MDLDPEIAVLAFTGTLSPLPLEAKRGVAAAGILGLLSFISCGCLFSYITYRVLKSRWTPREEPRRRSGPFHRRHLSDISARRGLKRDFTGGTIRQSLSPRDSENPRSGDNTTKPASGPNSFLTLINNILAADMFQSLTYILNLSWWRQDGIFVDTPTCAAQAFFLNIGGIALSAFLIGISLNTFLTIILGIKISRVAARYLVIGSWVFTFALAFAGVGMATHSLNTDEDRYYARAVLLCWVNRKYVSSFGFWLQNFWVILSIGMTIVCYAYIFLALSRHQQSSRRMPVRNKGPNAPPEPSGHHPAFLIYPVIYIICTTPITLVGLISAAGAHISVRYFSVASTLSSMAGLMDAILWSSIILFSSARDLEEVGLDEFDFIRAPERSNYGNVVWVEGPARFHNDGEQEGKPARGKWWRLSGVGRPLHGFSQERLANDQTGIHMDTVTTVTVEGITESGESDKSGVIRPSSQARGREDSYRLQYGKD